MKSFQIQNDLISKQEKQEYYNEVVPYRAGFVLSIPDNDISMDEYIYIKKIVKDLSPVTKPLKLARYLRIDSRFVFEAIKTNLIPHIKYGNKYFIKTEEILPLLRKHHMVRVDRNVRI